MNTKFYDVYTMFICPKKVKIRLNLSDKIIRDFSQPFSRVSGVEPVLESVCFYMDDFLSICSIIFPFAFSSFGHWNWKIFGGIKVFLAPFTRRLHAKNGRYLQKFSYTPFFFWVLEN